MRSPFHQNTQEGSGTASNVLPLSLNSFCGEERIVLGDGSGAARRAEHEAGGCSGQAQWPRLSAGEQQLRGFEHRLTAPAESHQYLRFCRQRYWRRDGRPAGFLQRPHRQNRAGLQMD